MNEKCLDDSPLQGACRTNACPHRSICSLPRVPLLVYAVVSNNKERRNYIDAYINDIFYLKAGGKRGESDFTGALPERISKLALKPWEDPESLFCDTEFLKELLGKDPEDVAADG